jgi:carbamoylphosphate synthase small subunit
MILMKTIIEITGISERKLIKTDGMMKMIVRKKSNKNIHMNHPKTSQILSLNHEDSIKNLTVQNSNPNRLEIKLLKKSVFKD